MRSFTLSSSTHNVLRTRVFPAHILQSLYAFVPLLFSVKITRIDLLYRRFKVNVRNVVDSIQTMRMLRDMAGLLIGPSVVIGRIGDRTGFRCVCKITRRISNHLCFRTALQERLHCQAKDFDNGCLCRLEDF